MSLIHIFPFTIFLGHAFNKFMPGEKDVQVLSFGKGAFVLKTTRTVVRSHKPLIPRLYLIKAGASLKYLIKFQPVQSDCSHPSSMLGHFPLSYSGNYLLQFLKFLLILFISHSNNIIRLQLQDCIWTVGQVVERVRKNAVCKMAIS